MQSSDEKRVGSDRREIERRKVERIGMSVPDRREEQRRAQRDRRNGE